MVFAYLLKFILVISRPKLRDKCTFQCKTCTTILTDLRLIEKLGDRKGTNWRVTERGLFILKQYLRRSVNSYNNQNNSDSLFYDANIPIRLHNVSCKFCLQN